jgi:AcrR family transcriptional regulator
MQATIELLSEQGYELMSLNAVAARAGVSKPTIYRRWPEGKEQLVSAAVAACREEGSPVDTGSLRGDLLASLEQMIEGMRENAHLAAGLTQRLRESPELAEVFRDEILAAKRQHFESIVRRAVERGELAGMPRNVSLLGDLGPSVIHARALILNEPLDSSFVNEFVDLVLIPGLTAAAAPRGAR